MSLLAVFQNSGLSQPLPGLPPLANQQCKVAMEQLMEIAVSCISQLHEGRRSIFNTVTRPFMAGVAPKIKDATTAEVTSSSSNVPVTKTLDHLFFLDAPGATGKTILIKALHTFLEVQRRKVIAGATSGVSASLLHHGPTAQSTLTFSVLSKWSYLHHNSKLPDRTSNYDRLLSNLRLL